MDDDDDEDDVDAIIFDCGDDVFKCGIQSDLLPKTFPTAIFVASNCSFVFEVQRVVQMLLCESSLQPTFL